jgi:hypothetical protein
MWPKSDSTAGAAAAAQDDGAWVWLGCEAADDREDAAIASQITHCSG